MTALASDIREMLREQVEFHELLRQMTKRDLLLRYKQTVMGFGWAIFMPLVNTAVFSVIFTRVAPLDTGVPYPLFAFCGLLTWNFSAASFRASVTSLTSNMNLVTKIYFPREILAFSSVLVAFVDFAVGSTVLAGLMAYYAVAPGLWILALPAVIAVHVVFTAAVCLMLAMANLFYRDVKYLFEVVITVWMFGTSVLYPVQILGGRVGLLAQANPMTPIIDGYRAVLFFNRSPFSAAFGLAALSAVVLLFVGWVTFHRAEFRFAENA